MSKKTKFRVALVLLVLFGLPFVSLYYLNQGLKLRKERRIPSFTLNRPDGSIFDSKQLEGKVWVAAFLFTRCGERCEPQVAALEKLQELFQDEPRFAEVMITIDPGFDSLPQLRNFAIAHDIQPKTWHLLTGSRDSIYNLILGGFLGKVKYGDGDPQRMQPDKKLVLIKPDFHIAGYYPVADSTDLMRLIDDIRGQLASM